MSAPLAPSRPVAGNAKKPRGSATAALAAALLGFFTIMLDAQVVNVALPSIRNDLGGGITGLQWVLDGYTLMFAALLLSAGSLADRFGARRAFGTGMAVFIAASAACGLAPNLAFLIGARLVQGAGAAIMLPSSLALIREAYPDPVRRGRAIAAWTVVGAVAAAAGPVAGGALNLISWRAIFFINLPAGAAALILLTRWRRSPRHEAPFDWTGQIAAVAAMGALTFGVIEAGADGFADPNVLAAAAVAAAALAVFLGAQARGKHPMVPLELLRSRAVVISSGTGFAFTAAYFGLIFLYSLYLQQQRALSSLAVGLVFLPASVLSGFVSPVSARFVERFGPRVPIIGGLLLMSGGLAALAVITPSASAWLLAGLIIPVGICGPLAIQPTTVVLLESVPSHRAGIASGIFNTSRQFGGALAIAVFGALIASRAHFLHGLRESLIIAAAAAVAAAAANLMSKPSRAPTSTYVHTRNAISMSAHRSVPKIALNDGTAIPQIGFGTLAVQPDREPSLSNTERTAEIVGLALQAGYRHIDTAQSYGNERGVGRAIAASGIPREELYVTSKLASGNHRPDDVRHSFDETLENLGLDQLDLFLIHWPLPTLYDGDYVSTWKAMTDLVALGRLRSAGVSNFQPAHLDRIIAETGIVPAVNQVELHPYFANHATSAAAARHGIAVEAHSPLGHDGKPLDDETITRIAASRGKSSAQVILRWHLQHGHIVIPKSARWDRMEDNLNVIDFELSGEEMKSIDALDKGESGRAGPKPDTYEGI